jgi:hypothetical protein
MRNLISTLFALLIFGCLAHSQEALMPLPQQFFDVNGAPLAGGKVFTYQAGTTNQQATFTDSTGLIQNSNPVILNAGGFPMNPSGGIGGIWLAPQFYKIVVQNSLGVEQYTVDNVSSYNFLPGISNITFSEASSCSGASGFDILCGLSGPHRLGMINNATTLDLIVGQNTTDTLSNKTLAQPIIHSPQIDNPTITGTISTPGAALAVSSLNKVVYCDQQTGGTADVQITAAIALLPAVGGTIDCRGYGATTQTIAAPIAIGSASKQVLMIIDRATQFNVTITSGADAIQLWIESSLIALDMGNVQAVGNFVVTPATSINNLIASYPRAGPSIVNVRGITLVGNPAAVVTGAMMDLAGVTDHTTVQDVIAYNFAGPGLRIQNVAGGVPVGPLNITNNSWNGSGNAGAKPVQINCVVGGGVIADINFFGGSMTHPGSGGLSMIDVEGGASNCINGVNLYGVQFESINAGDIGLNLVNALGVTGSGLVFTSATTNGTSNIKISQSGGFSYNLTFDNITNYNGWTNTIADTINSVNITDARVSHYTYLPPTSSAYGVYSSACAGLCFGLSNTGVSNNAAGFKHKRQAGCTTGGTAGNTCTNTVTWTTAFPDTNYTPVCTLLGTATLGHLGAIAADVIAAGSVKVETVTDTNAAITGTVQCIAVHD